MSDNEAQAARLKQEGNAHFGRKNYAAAESCYSQACVVPLVRDAEQVIE